MRDVVDRPVASAVDAPGRVIAVWGPEGSPGRTTVAVSLAAARARWGRGAVLVDADPVAPSVAQQLAVVEEQSGLLAASQLVQRGELDHGLDGVLRRYEAGFSLLTGLPRVERWRDVPTGALAEIARAATRHGDVVLDLGASLEAATEPGAGGFGPGRHQLTVDGLAAADAVVVVTGADPVGLSRLGRALPLLWQRVARDGATPPMAVVVNKMRDSLGWRERDVREVVRELVSPEVGVFFLPERRELFDRTVLRGGTILGSESAGDLVGVLDTVLTSLGLPAVRGEDRPGAALRLRLALMQRTRSRGLRR